MPSVILGFLGITLLTGFIAGCYPAFYLSAFNPIAVLKGKMNVSLGEIMGKKRFSCLSVRFDYFIYRRPYGYSSTN